MILGNCDSVCKFTSKKLIGYLRHLALILILLAGAKDASAVVACDTTYNINHYALIFQGMTYNPLAQTSNWNYTLRWDGVSPGPSSVKLELYGLVSQANLISSVPANATIGLDAATGIYGIKWNNIQNIQPNTPVNFSFTLNTILGIDEYALAPDVGINAVTTRICGPSNIGNVPPRMKLNGGDHDGGGGGSDHYDTTVFLCSPQEICIPIKGDDDDNEHIWLTKLSGSGTFGGCDDSDGHLDTTICFTPDTAGVYCFELELDDDGDHHGDKDDDDDIENFCVTVVYNSAPIANCPSNTTRNVCNLNQICLPGFTATDPNNNIATKVVTGGTLTGTTVCFTPVAGNNLIRFIVIDACGKADTCETNVNVILNSAPDAMCPGNSSLLVCNLIQICIPGFTATDPNNNISSKTVIGGTLSGTSVCFTPIAGNNLIKFIVTDSCGKADTCQTTINVTLNAAPVATCPGNSTLSICNLNQICIPGFTATDPNNNIATKVVTGGTLTGTTVCFTPAVGNNLIKFIVTDSCGKADTCQTTINVILNAAPVASCPGNSSMFVCNLNQICIPGFTVTDPNNNISTKIVTGGTLSGTTVCFNPVAGNNLITFIVTDSCGAADTCTTTINVTLNAPPVAACPGNSSIAVCNTNQICVSGFTATDPNNNIATKVVTGGTLTGSTVCFTPVNGNNLITFIVTDSCGKADTCQTTVNVTLNAPPVATCPGNSSMAVCNLNQICIPGFTTSDPNNNIASKVVTGGTLTGTTVCFMPVAGNNLITLIVTDSCGASDTCTTTINVALNSPPVATCPGSESRFVCNMNQICISGFTAADPNNNIASKVVTGGILTGSTVCFTPVMGNNRIIFTVTDSCGSIDACTTNVSIALNSPPVATGPGNISNFFCGNPGNICIPNFVATDPNNNIATKVATGGTLSGTSICLTPVVGLNTIIFTVTDSCGMVDACTTLFNVQLNTPPVASCPGNESRFVCDLNQICLPGFTASDPNNNIRTRTVLGGTLSGTTVCLNPVSGNNTITFIVTDSCGAADTCQTTINVRLNSAPVVQCPAMLPDIKICSLGTYTCVSGDQFTYSDGDNNVKSSTINGLPFTPGSPYCFNANATGLYNLTFICTDSCNKSDTCVAQVNIIQECPTGCAAISIEKTHNTSQGQYESVAVTIDSMPYGIGGFDLLIQYDASALGMSQVEPGSFITGCGWEYFNYRNGASGNCGVGACPTGFVRIIAIGETNNGPNHPDCFQMQPAHLADLVFLVTNDRTFECQYVPIRFVWYDCGDNTLSSVAGDSLYISGHVFDYYNDNAYTEITNLGGSFPSWAGANANCDVSPGNGKPGPTRCLDFYNGGIDIVCADSIDARGDLNLNGISNEVADAVLLGNYFVYGIGVFTVNMQGQIAASDVNADGTILSVADLVYLIRVVVGDALPLSKAAIPVSVKYTHSEDGRLSVDNRVSIGAALVIVQGQVQPTLLADGMEFIHNFDGSNTRILVWSVAGNSFTGDFLQVGGEITSVEMATAEGNPVNLNVIPTKFALQQNYPNPFNPKTVISFSLPNASDYKLAIYNVKGQEVASFTGTAENAGTFEIGWEAANYSSGIYFYKLVAGSYSQTKKMILLK